MTQRLPTAVARKDFANVLRDSAAGERIKLTRYNKTVAVIIPKKDLTDLEDCQRLHGPEASSEEPQANKPAHARTPASGTKPQTKAQTKAHKKSDK
jgi:antitoxin (DNA-binding transcriptional repressor) of toxin-antitoxin stability system